MTYSLSFNMLWETKKYVAFLGREVPARFISERDNQEPTARQIAILDSVDDLSQEIVPQLVEWAQRDLQTRLSNWGITIDELEIEIEPDNLQNHFSINEILVPRIGDCKINYIFLAGACDWDEEHGIEFLLKDGKPISCGAQEGLALNKSWDAYLQV
jgi:hypothetical protein